MHICAVVLCFFINLDISGYVETRPFLYWNDSLSIAGYNRGWIEFKTDGLDYGTQVALDLIVPYDTTSFSFAIDNIEISRLALWIGPENLRLVAGKQKLYWGVARIFRPLDVFNPVNYFEPGYEKPGSNALLGYISLGTLTSIRGVIIPQNDIKQSLYGTRFGTNLLKNDIGLNIMHRPSEEKTIIGAEIAGELILGYWGEYSYTWEDTVDYSKFSFGIDYTFPFMIYTMGEYFFDGSGEDDSASYDFVKIYSGERTTLAQQYLYFTISIVPDPFAIVQPRISNLINLNDRSLIIVPQVSFSIFENTDIIVGLNYFLGSQRSEFKNITPFDGAVYVWMKVYF